MSKYKIGEKVRVRDNLERGTYYGEVLFIGDMVNTRGKEVTILENFEEGTYRTDANDWTYSDEMLESVEPFHFEGGDIVKLNPDARLGDFARYGTSLYIYEGTAALLSAKLGVTSFDHEFTVKVGRIQGGVNTLLLEGFEDYCFESALFTLVCRPEKVKEITMAELEEKFGCKVKIVKGEHDE